MLKDDRGEFVLCEGFIADVDSAGIDMLVVALVPVTVVSVVGIVLVLVCVRCE